MTILQVVAKWSGFPGGPGYSNFYITNAGLKQTAVNNGAAGVRAFFDAIKAALPALVTVQVQQEVKELDASTGALIGLENVSALPAAVTGAGSMGAGPAGAVVIWGTSGVNRGKRVQGRTFLVPLNTNAYEGDGTLTASVVSVFAAAAQAYRTSAAYETLVWSRPRNGTGGAAFPILTSRVPDLAAVLRSRRD